MNAYPNGRNYLLPSFNPAVEPPDVDPDEGVLISVAYNPAWTKVLAAAATQLSQYAAWEGTHDEKILAVQRANRLIAMLTIDVGTVQTPFWDDETDVEESEPVEDQEWYGEVTNPTAPADELDFVENAALWFFTGLIALATFEVAGIAPAVVFHTTVEKFLVVQKRGDVAETIRFVVDGQDMKYVNTAPYAPGEIIETQIFTPQTGGSHTLMIIGGSS